MIWSLPVVAALEPLPGGEIVPDGSVVPGDVAPCDPASPTVGTMPEPLSVAVLDGFVSVEFDVVEGTSVPSDGLVLELPLLPPMLGDPLILPS